MTKKERIRRYEAIVRWGKEYLASKQWISFDSSLLEEYARSLTELKKQKDA